MLKSLDETDTCCRKCIQKWHGIGKGRALNAQEVYFVVALVMGWVEGQMNKKVFFDYNV
jgi:exodeoxyribonuclease V alpha subunit